MTKPLYYTRCHSAHYILRLPATKSVDLAGKKMICPSCNMEVIIGQAHPLVPVYSKPKFYRRKDLSGVTETVDEYGWTTDAVLDAPTELKYDGVEQTKDNEPEPLPDTLIGMKVINKKDKTYYDQCIYDIHQEGKRVVGSVWLMYVELSVYQTAPDTWREYKRTRVYHGGELNWYVLGSDDELKLTCVRGDADPLVGQASIWSVEWGPYESEYEADLMMQISIGE